MQLSFIGNRSVIRNKKNMYRFLHVKMGRGSLTCKKLHVQIVKIFRIMLLSLYQSLDSDCRGEEGGSNGAWVLEC